jgi:hypothetical protein
VAIVLAQLLQLRLGEIKFVGFDVGSGELEAEAALIGLGAHSPDSMRGTSRGKRKFCPSISTPTREEDRHLVAGLQAVEEKLPLAQEVEPSDIVGLLHVIAWAHKRFADRLGIVDRLFELLLVGKIVVGVNADNESDALGRVCFGARSEGKQAETQGGNQADHFPLRQGAGDRDGGECSVSPYRLQLEPPLNERQGKPTLAGGSGARPRASPQPSMPLPAAPRWESSTPKREGDIGVGAEQRACGKGENGRNQQLQSPPRFRVVFWKPANEIDEIDHRLRRVAGHHRGRSVVG